MIRPIKLGDVVTFDSRQWQVSGRSHRPDGVRLLLVAQDAAVPRSGAVVGMIDDWLTASAPVAECELVGTQHPLPEGDEP